MILSRHSLRVAPGLLLLGALLAVSVSRSGEATGRDEVFASANADFGAGDFDEAATRYQSLVEQGLASPDLYYNLGTAKFRQGETGAAVLWMRRARILDPGLPEARQNLEFLRQRLGLLEFSESGIDRALRTLPAATSSWVATLAFWGAALALAAAFSVARLRPNRSGLVTLAILLLLLATVAWRLGVRRETRLAEENFATVISSGASALTSPAPSAKPVIELPPGSEVRILQEDGPWRYVDIPGNLRGWIRAEAAEPNWPIPPKEP